ncbi:MAG TPA: peptidoglycan-binding protein [Clostridium sp.]|uniref:peptidoglycan-binding domain-containing protein n=1 Tax=Clostridium sp. TaxID=1506 RepID=UPI002F94F4A8
MNKILKPFTCALVAIFALSTSVTSSTLGSLGVDTVSAATVATPAPAPTPTPTPSSSGSSSSSSSSSSSGSYSSGSSSSSTATTLSGTLQSGSRGSAVTLLQTKLNTVGYKLHTDGIFGSLTVEAVRNYQALHGLAVDGIAGPATFLKLTPPVVAKVTSFALGSTGVKVKSLQTKLNTVGYKLVVDGTFGNLTKIAVANYQGLHALAVDGIAGPATLAKLFPVKATVAVAPVLKLGSRGTAVKALQTKLNTKGYKLVPDGIFGNLTVAAVKNYQALHNLVANGIVGATTYAKLNAVVKPPVVTPPVTTPPTDVTTTASIVDNIAAFKTAISPSGKWIAATVKDLTTTDALVLDGDLNEAGVVKREIALYAQTNGVVSARYTLTAPKLTIKSANANISNGTFKGDIYVTVPNFQLKGAKVVGNIHFTTQAIKDTFKMDATSSVSGSQIVDAPPTDVVTTASIVNTAAKLETAISAPATGGTWIVAILNNITSTKDLVLDAKFLNGKADAVTAVPLVQRKLALYAQDAAHVVTARYTLTAPSLTIKSPNASVEHGTFKGDVYVNSRNFKLIDNVIVGNVYVHSTEFALSKNAKIQGNVYFDNIEAQKTFTMEAGSTVTGTQGYKATTAVDSVTSASRVNDPVAFEKAISPTGTWIIAAQRDMVVNHELVLDGDVRKVDTSVPPVPAAAGRKIALYFHDGDNYTTARFTLTAPKLTIKSIKSNISKGIFKGTLNVAATGFSLVDARIEGDVYFATQAIKDSFTMDATSSITGQQIVGTAPDVVAAASIVDNAADFATEIGTQATGGNWIVGLNKDIVSPTELVIDGPFLNKATPPVSQRKIVLYTRQLNAAGVNVETARFTITTPKLTVNSPDCSISNGTIKGDLVVNTTNFKLSDVHVTGDVHVNATNFTILKGTKIDGKVIFGTQGSKDTFKIDTTATGLSGATSSVTGTQAVEVVDAVTTASIVKTDTALVTALSASGNWITAILNNITTTKALVVDGNFSNTKTPPVVSRKIALYTQAKQDGVNTVTNRFTLKAPSLSVNSPSTSIQHGTFIGDVNVSAVNFGLIDATITGNVHFATQALKDAFMATPLDATSKVTGTVDVVAAASAAE